MRASVFSLALSLLTAGGCRTHLSLRDNTLATTETLTDLNYQQVLDNLARFVANPLGHALAGDHQRRHGERRRSKRG